MDMVDRQGKGRDCRDGAWVPIGMQHVVRPRRSLERLGAEYWRFITPDEW